MVSIIHSDPSWEHMQHACPLTRKSFAATASNPLLARQICSCYGAIMYNIPRHVLLGLWMRRTQASSFFFAQSTCADTVSMDECKTKQQLRIHGGWSNCGICDRDWSVRKSFAFRRVHTYTGLAGIKQKIQNEKAHDPWPKTCNIDRGKWAAIGQSNHRHRRQSGTLSSERRWNSSVDDGACQHWSRVATNGGLWCDNFNTLCSSE